MRIVSALLSCVLVLPSPVARAAAPEVYTFTPPAGFSKRVGGITGRTPRSIVAPAPSVSSASMPAGPAPDSRRPTSPASGGRSSGDHSGSPCRRTSTSAAGSGAGRYSSGSGHVVSAASGAYAATLYVYAGPSRLFSIVVDEAKRGCGTAASAFLSSLRLTAAAGRGPPPSPAPRTQAQPADTTPAPGGVTRLGEVAFRLHDDWRLLSSPVFPGARLARHVELAPRHLHPGEWLTVLVFDATPAARSPEDELATGWREIISGLGATAGHDVYGKHYKARARRSFDDGASELEGRGALDRSGGHYDMALYVVALGGRMVRVAAIARVLPSSASFLRTTPLASPRFLLALPRLLLDLEVRGHRLSSRVKPPASSRPVAGVWTGISMFGGLLKVAYVNFYPDGRVYFGSRPPWPGFHGLDCEADALRSQAYWGTYRFNGKRGVVSLPGRRSRFPMRLEGRNLVITTHRTPHRFIRLRTVDGTRIDGRYRVRLSSTSFASLRFTRGGGFVDRGVLKALDHDTYAFRASDRPGRGRYEIRDYSLILRFDDGRRLALPFLGTSEPGTATPRELRIGTEDSVLTRG